MRKGNEELSAVLNSDYLLNHPSTAAGIFYNNGTVFPSLTEKRHNYGHFQGRVTKM